MSSLASKFQDFKLKGLQIDVIKRLKNRHSKFKNLTFCASEHIMTKFKSQALHIIRINY